MSAPPSRPLAVPGLVLGLLIGAVLTNVSEFAAIERGTSAGYSAVTRYPSPDMVDLTLTPTSAELYGIYLDLSEVAPGATLRLPSMLGLHLERAVGLGRVRVTIEPDLVVDPAVSEGLDPFIVASGTSQAGEYVIAVAEVPAAELVGFRKDEVIYFVDTTLLSGSPDEAPAG